MGSPLGVSGEGTRSVASMPELRIAARVILRMSGTTIVIGGKADALGSIGDQSVSQSTIAQSW